MEPDIINKILDVLAVWPTAHVQIEPDGSLKVRRGPGKDFHVMPDGTILKYKGKAQ